MSLNLDEQFMISSNEIRAIFARYENSRYFTHAYLFGDISADTMATIDRHNELNDAIHYGHSLAYFAPTGIWLNPAPEYAKDSTEMHYYFRWADVCDFYQVDPAFHAAIDSEKYVYCEGRLILKNSVCLSKDSQFLIISPPDGYSLEDVSLARKITYEYISLLDLLGESSNSIILAPCDKDFTSEQLNQEFLDLGWNKLIDSVTAHKTGGGSGGGIPPTTLQGFILYHMEIKHFTVEALAEASHLSDKTILRLRSNPEYRPSIDTLMAVAIGLRLYSPECLTLFALGGYILTASPRGAVDKV